MDLERVADWSANKLADLIDEKYADYIDDPQHNIDVKKRVDHHEVTVEFNNGVMLKAKVYIEPHSID